VRVRIVPGRLARLKADVIACFAFEGDRAPLGLEAGPLRAALAFHMKREAFRGSRRDLLVFNADGRYGARRYLVVGLGRRGGDPAAAIRDGCARGARQADKFNARSFGVCVPPADDGARAADLVQAAAEGAILGSYRFARYLTDPSRRTPPVEEVRLAAAGARDELEEAIRRAEAGAEAVCFARDLVNEPPSVLTPIEMARRAEKEGRAAGLEVKVLGRAELARLRMNALLSVARGSAEPPAVVHLVYRPRGRPASGRVVLVGKGVTFDSGGLNIKPSGSMADMKADMAGAAAVLAAMRALPGTRCRAEVHGLLGLVENMVGGGAFKPGDIVVTASGKTVEVRDTDAEGRLVLCDLLAYASERLKPDRIVDVATLTGACVVALGPLATGVFSRDERLREELLSAGARAGEKLWPMPLYDEYLDQLQAGPADLRNVGDRWGGAIKAALFLGEFVRRELPWAHLDIAGPAYLENERPELPAGATGAGTLTLVRWLETL
jgi:leucyl aminopeptidase